MSDDKNNLNKGISKYRSTNKYKDNNFTTIVFDASDIINEVTRSIDGLKISIIQFPGSSKYNGYNWLCPSLRIYSDKDADTRWIKVKKDKQIKISKLIFNQKTNKWEVVDKSNLTALELKQQMIPIEEDDEIIVGFSTKDISYHFISKTDKKKMSVINFPPSSKYKGYYWFCPTDNIKNNKDHKTDKIYSFNPDKRWVIFNKNERIKVSKVSINKDTKKWEIDDELLFTPNELREHMKRRSTQLMKLQRRMNK